MPPLADIYGERRLLDAGLLPASLVFAHPQYLRPMHGMRAAGRRRICTCMAFELMRGARRPVVGGRPAHAVALGPGLPAGEPADRRRNNSLKPSAIMSRCSAWRPASRRRCRG